MVFTFKLGFKPREFGSIICTPDYYLVLMFLIAPQRDIFISKEKTTTLSDINNESVGFPRGSAVKNLPAVQEIQEM